MARCRKDQRAAFSLLELLVVLAVTALLIGLLMPSLMHIRQSAQQVACAARMYQIGVALEIYSDDYDDRFPSSYFAGAWNRSSGRYDREPMPQEMMAGHRGGDVRRWDGLGRLVPKQYISDPENFYCPAHRGENAYSQFEKAWDNPGSDPIFTNFHFRGILNKTRDGSWRVTANVDKTQIRRFARATALVTDGLRTRADFSHRTGNNVLDADMSVRWAPDPGERIYRMLPERANSGDGDTVFLNIIQIWDDLDDERYYPSY